MNQGGEDCSDPDYEKNNERKRSNPLWRENLAQPVSDQRFNGTSCN